MANPLADDLDLILRATGDLWEPLRGARIFITGGTGFFGKWLLESFAWANERLALHAETVVLTRHPETAAARLGPIAAHQAIQFHPGDVRDFTFPPGRFSHVIHAATESSAKRNAENPLLMLDTIVQGTRRVLDFAVQSGAKRFLLTSSGAVYGPQPPELSLVPEEFSGAPDPCEVHSAYGQGKRIAEQLCALYHQAHGVEPLIARCFAFVGPHLPLDAHFAIGNFIRDALRGGPIVVAGDGTPYRSYLYAADLMIWLWTILLRGVPGRAYNVGSEEPVSIAELANIVADVFATTHGQRPVVEIRGKPQAGVPAMRYVPATRRAAELGLQTHADLRQAVARTIRWHQSNPGAQSL